jgi:hypothetical protein
MYGGDGYWDYGREENTNEKQTNALWTFYTIDILVNKIAERNENQECPKRRSLVKAHGSFVQKCLVPNTDKQGNINVDKVAQCKHHFNDVDLIVYAERDMGLVYDYFESLRNKGSRMCRANKTRDGAMNGGKVSFHCNLDNEDLHFNIKESDISFCSLATFQQFVYGANGLESECSRYNLKTLLDLWNKKQYYKGSMGLRKKDKKNVHGWTCLNKE